ncbi:MAG: tRNA pseudouridine(38-40) synthase TruA, partial [Candidatus Puniceispirillaceae bacterium]
MTRYLIRIEYDGTGLVGWQRQDNGPSVQQFLEEAAEKLTGQPTAIQGSGRTDSGVHALGQAAHLDV